MSSLDNLKARQIKAARALVDWSQDELADHAGLSVATIRKIELSHISPRGTTMQAIRRAFDDAGLEFLEPNGVRQRPDDIMIYQGEDGFLAFFDDVYDVAQKKGGEIVCVIESEDPFEKILGDRLNQRMVPIQHHTKVKCLITRNKDNLFYSEYCNYKFLPKGYVECVPFYIYGDKYAVIIFETENGPRVTVFRSPVLAAEYRKMFASMWDKAVPLNDKSEEKAKSKAKQKGK